MEASKWKLNGIPVYPDGELFDELFEVGGGLNGGFGPEDEARSRMHLVNGTTAEAFLAYCGELARAGFRPGFSRDAAHGLYREFVGDGRIVYAYFMRRTGQARIIDDRASLSAADFGADDPRDEVRGDSELMQFGLFYGDPLRGRVSTCGMLYVVRGRNNELFLVDGGERAQSTDDAFDELMLRLRELTGTQEGEPMTIACWFCTHAHDDHMDLFINLMRRHGDVLKVKRILFNFPEPDYAGVPPEFREKFVGGFLNNALEALKQYCPGAKYLKAHTGQCFRFGSMTAEVLLTHEDVYYENDQNVRLIGLNNSSTLLRLSFDGSSLLILGDADEPNGDVLRKYYEPDEVSCTYLQAAHHLANRDENIYTFVKAQTVLIPQGRLRVNRIRRDHYAVLCENYDRDRFHLEGDYTIVFRVNDGAEEITYYQLQGGPFRPEVDGHNLWREYPPEL